MKLEIRLPYKLFLIIALFLNGLIIAAIIFPALSLVCSTSSAKANKDKLKTRWLKWFGAILNLRVVIEGKLPERGVIIVSNHISWLDIIVLGQFLPAYFVAKSDISNWPIIGYLARQGGTIFIRRGDKQHIRTTTEKMVWLLKQNSTIIAFPEGTTTMGDDVLAFHSSLLQPALLTKAMIQPAAIQYQGLAKDQAPFIGDDGFIPHLIKMLRLNSIDVHLAFLPVINCTGKSRHTLSVEARDLIAEKIFNHELVNNPLSKSYRKISTVNQ
jgi:lyso-ornithine lipid O-acyltransferase